MRRVLLGMGIAAVGAIIVLLFLPSEVHLTVADEGHPGYTTECSSIVAAGWPRDLAGSSDDKMVAQGATSTDDSDGPAYEICQTRRTLYSAGIGILAIPASSLVVLAATRAQRRALGEE
jgi:hypothetical protein